MRLAKLLLLLLIVGVCHAQPLNIDDVREDNEERDAWLAGVFTPQPLRPAPWQLGEDTAPSAPAPSDGLQVPGVGELHGLRGYKTIKNRPIDAFLGVRYAYFNASGLGRFQAAEAAAYQGHIDATSSKGNCAQFPELQRLQEAEARGEDVDDCLFLDIYAPAGARDLPVLVFVHGEMLFDGGAEEAQPDYVLEHDVILVSVNYRLAPFGFLSALSDQLPGNVALSDLHLALQWVQRNIGYFGGRASQVTLIGQAGGATLAHALSLSPRTQHLFQQLTLQSGTALNPYLIDERPLDTLLTFARFARCPTPAGRNLSPLYECLAGLSTSQLVAAFEQLLQQNEKLGLTALGGFKLVIGDRLGYLPEHPAALVVSNSNNNRTKPLIVGATKDAGAFILSRFYEQVQGLRSQNLSDYINLVLRHTAPPQDHKIWHDWALREIFEPGQEINVRGVTQGLLELINLILYRAPVINSIRLSYRKSPAYLYTFDYRGEYHRFGHLDNPLPFAVDASLSDDSVYLFPYPVDTSRLNPEDLSLARALTAMWVNFAADGIPNPNANVWPKASSEYGPFLRFTNSRENTLELDQHFGEGINIPNLYPQYFRVNTTNVAPTRVATIPVVINPVPPTTTTTTTTTRRPYVVYTTPRQPIRPQPRPDLRRPLTGTHYTRVQQMELELEEKRLRELQARDEQLRREQQQREQLQREQQQREEQQKREQLQRELEQREQLQREEQRQRELQQQQEEEYLRAVQEQELKEREQRQREQFDRNQVDGTPAQETEPQVDERDPYEALIRHEEEEQKRLRDQYEREQHERNQSQEPQPQDDDREREEQDLLRQQYEREQREREQYEREQQRELGPQAADREQEQQREAALRRQQAEREQYEREREQFPESPVEELDPYEEQRRQQEEEQRREQQQRDQYEREQQEREPDQESQPQEDDQERDLLREAQLRREQAERDQYEWEQRRREQYERDQEQREQQEQEQDQESQPQEDDRERELQRQEQLRREQAEREEYEWQRRQQEEQLRENQQLERESQEEHQEEEAQWDNQGNQGNREQQEGQVEAEQPTQSEGPQVEDFATYNEYVEAYSAWVESYAKQQEGRLNQVQAAASNNDPADPYDADDY